MKTFDEWFVEHYGVSFEERTSLYSVPWAIQLLTEAVRQYVTYVAQTRE